MLRSLRRALFLVIATSVSVSTGNAASKWLKLETPDVIVLSDASRKDMVEYAIGYTAYRAAFQTMFGPPVRLQRPTVLLFSDRDTFQKYAPAASPGYQTLSFSAPVDGAVLNALAVEGDRDEALAQTYQFETVFALNRCGYYLPLWMAQGAGEVLESMELRKDHYEIGDFGRYSWGALNRLPWPRFFEINTGSPEYTGPSAHGVFHCQAWALMHRVLLGEGEPAANFGKLASALASNRDQFAAVRSFLNNVPADKMDHEIREHLSKHVRKSYSFDAASLRKTLVPGPAQEVEVDVQISNLLFGAGKDNQGELELARAQYLEPASVAVKEARARAALRRRDYAEAAALYREAIAMGSTNPWAYLRSAEDHLGISSGSGRIYPGSAGDLANTAIEEIRHVLALDPGNPDAYALLGKAIYLAPEVRDEDIAELNHGVTRGPQGAQVCYSRALVYQRQQKYTECMADLRAVMSEPYAPIALRKIARSMFIDVAFKPIVAEVEKFVKDGKFAEAKTELADARKDQQNEEVIAQIDKLDHWVQEREAWGAVVRAVEAKDDAVAAEQAKAFLERFPLSELRAAAKQIVQQSSRSSSPP